MYTATVVQFSRLHLLPVPALERRREKSPKKLARASKLLVRQIARNVTKLKFLLPNLQLTLKLAVPPYSPVGMPGSRDT